MLTYAALHMAAQVLSTLDILVPQVGYSSTRVGELIQVHLPAQYGLEEFAIQALFGRY